MVSLILNRINTLYVAIRIFHYYYVNAKKELPFNSELFRLFLFAIFFRFDSSLNSNYIFLKITNCHFVVDAAALEEVKEGLISFFPL